MNSFVVSARKYRPTRFDEVVGQEHISSTLKNALKTGHLAQAYLFCGPRGVGKTTCARILAKVLNCENRTEDFEPCNKCRSCQAFNDNASMNIIELDAASHNSVENMRMLNEQVRILPQEGKYRIFIIDEVHMLSTAAFNAFLKTLEEPPEYVVFILATTEKHKIIPTILSRCQIYDFRRISVTDMVSHLAKVASSEGVEAEEDALNLIAQKSDGALRDALTIFDRMISFSGEKLTVKDVVQNLNLLDRETFFMIGADLLSGNVSDILNHYNDILRNGFEGQQFLDGLSQHLRDLLICKDPNTLNLLEVSKNLKNKYRDQSAKFDIRAIMKSLQVVNQTSIDYLRANNKRLHVEICLLKLAGILSSQEKKSPELSETREKLPEPPRPTPVEKAGEVKPETSSPSATAKPVNKGQDPSVAEQRSPQAEDQPKKESKPEKEFTPDRQSVTEDTPVSSKQVPETKSERTQKEDLLSSNPLLGMNLSDLENNVRQELARKKQEQVKMIQEEVELIWKEYSAELSSQSVKTIFKKAVIEVSDPVLQIFVGSEIEKNTIMAETGFIEKLREKYGHDRLTLNIDLDSSLAPEEKEKPNKFLTTKEKYDKMRSTNPLIDDMRKRFDLKLDED